MADTQDVLNGKITYVLYRNESNFYTVARFLINDEKERTITITGMMPEVEQDVVYNIYGHYTEHPKYGLQFAVESYDKPLPQEQEGIISYLSSARFPGIGKKTAEKIVSVLGEGCLEDIRKDPSILHQVEGLSEKHIQSIRENINQDDDELVSLYRFLNIHGIGARNTARIYKAYGKKALDKIRENPYCVIEDCEGFGFATADKMAQSMGVQPDDPRRLYAYLVSLTMDLCMKNGNSFIRLEALEEAFHKKIKNTECDFSDLLEEAVMKRSLVREENRIYPVTQYDAEKEIADYLSGFPYEDLDPADPDLVQKYLNAMEKDIGITYGEKQTEAIQSFFANPFLIMTGGPGTGKTTVVRAMVTLFRLIYPEAEVVCAAPTGRAAKRLAELTETGTATIHSLLQWDLDSNTFGKNEDEPIHADLLIIDEFSMVDSYLFSALLKASRHVRKICVIGDEDQLPSVGPGCVLRDLIDCKEFPVIRLDHIYRQKNGSDVIALAHDIREGKADFTQYTHDVAFLNCPSAAVKNTILNIVQNALEKGYEMDDIQVLSPMYAGNAGIDVLNNALQEEFNPYEPLKKQVKRGYMIFREGDKILQLKNQPDDDVYNGDIGTLEEILDAEETEDHKTTIVVNFQGNYVEYIPENWNNITLAYCISVHKSQGSEYPIVIMPFVRQHTIMLQRKLIYTAITRARKSLVLLGDPDVFQRGIETIDRHPRETTLAQRIRKASDPFDA